MLTVAGVASCCARPHQVLNPEVFVDDCGVRLGPILPVLLQPSFHSFSGFMQSQGLFTYTGLAANHETGSANVPIEWPNYHNRGADGWYIGDGLCCFKTGSC